MATRNKKISRPESERFSEVPRANIQRSKFDRSHSLKTTFDAGLLVPIFVDEAIPGDTFSLSMNGFARLATPLKPIMDNLYLETFWFFIPNRLVWDNWNRFMGEQIDPGDSTDYLVPTITSTPNVDGKDLRDYMGLPTGVAVTYSALPFRALNLVWNEWFRDQNLQNSVAVPRGDGPDNSGTYGMLRRGKRHDYFTSALPWPQKGESVELPLGDRAPVAGIGKGSLTWTGAGTQDVYESGIGLVTYGEPPNSHTQIDGETLNEIFYVSGEPEPGDDPLETWPAIYADLSSATSATINELRQSFQIQKMLERDARGGTRYTEIIRSHFGVVSPDMRLQRPEYLGGGSTPITISPVAQTTPGDDTPQGNLAAVGTASWSGHGWTKSFTEHGIILGLASVRADITYQQGLERQWSRATRFDYYWPALAQIGEQAVLAKEIYADGTVDDESVFGYQERYAEYRYKPSRITGQFRSTTSTPLDVWHLAQEFGSRPELSPGFIQENPPLERVLATPDEPHILFDAHFRLRCARPMPVYGVPGMIDHF